MQALANLAWSMAHLNCKHEVLLDAIVNQLLSDVDDMNQRDLADLLSALAMLKHQPITQAMDAVVQHTIYLLQDPGTLLLFSNYLKRQSCTCMICLISCNVVACLLGLYT